MKRLSVVVVLVVLAVLGIRHGWPAAAHDGDAAHNRKDDLIAKLTEALLDEPDNEKYLEQRGYAFLQQNEYESGLADFDHLLRLPLKPKFAEVVHTLHALGLFKVANYKGALADLDPVCSASTTVSGAWFLRGELRHELGDDVGARSDLDHGLGLAPSQFPHGRIVRASVLAATGDQKGARADLDRVIENNPRDKEALLARALLLVDADWAASKKDLEDVLAMPFATEDPAVRATEARIQLRRNGMITEIYQKALELYDRDVKSSRSLNRRAALTLEAARLRVEMRDFWPGVKMVKDAIEWAPDRVDSHRLYVKLLETAPGINAETKDAARERLAEVERTHGVASPGSASR